MKTYILLENVVFFAFHGVLRQEQTLGNEFVVNLKIEVDLLKACQTDNVDDTISYADVYQIVKAEMATPSQLLEHVAYRIINCLKQAYPPIELVEVKVSKRNPPFGGQLDCASVLIIG